MTFDFSKSDSESQRKFKVPSFGFSKSVSFGKLKTKKKQILIILGIAFAGAAVFAAVLPEIIFKKDVPVVRISEPLAVSTPVADGAIIQSGTPAASANANEAISTDMSIKSDLALDSLKAPASKVMVDASKGPSASVTVSPIGVTALDGPSSLSVSDRKLLEDINNKLSTLSATSSKSYDILDTLQNSVNKIAGLLGKSNGSVSAGKGPRQDFVAISILDIAPNYIVISDGGKKVSLLPGERLPGGTIFIGFDTATRTMKTDHGDFVIPG